MDETAREAPVGAESCVLIRRQAIFDQQERLAGYELLLDIGKPPAQDEDGQGLVASACVDIGLRRIVGTHRTYITATPAVLAGAAVLRLAPEQVVLQLPEQPVGRPLLRTLGRLLDDGFRVGVGGWALDADDGALLSLASVVKIDVHGRLDPTDLRARGEQLHARGVTLIADHVQTHGEYAHCRRLGFDAFQGEYLAHPAPVAGRRTPTAAAAALAAVLRARAPAARHFLGLGLHRARVCKLLAAQQRDASPDRAFSAGLLSVLPALTSEPLDDLPLDDRLAGALSDYLGPEGQILAAMIAHESGQRANADHEPQLLAAIGRLYASTLLWADEAARRLS